MENKIYKNREELISELFENIEWLYYSIVYSQSPFITANISKTENYSFHILKIVMNDDTQRYFFQYNDFKNNNEGIVEMFNDSELFRATDYLEDLSDTQDEEVYFEKSDVINKVEWAGKINKGEFPR